jgi:hypothetical protein
MKGIKFLLVLLFISLTCTLAHATTVTFTLVSRGDNEYEYRYTLRNNTLNVAIQQVTIYFDAASYTQLHIPGSPAGWDALVVASDANFPTPVDGFYDVLAVSAGIAPESSQGDFTVRFRWLGAGSPGSQRFTVVNPRSFQTLETGLTVPAAPIPVPIPALSGWYLFLLGLLLVGAGWRWFSRYVDVRTIQVRVDV